MSNASDALEKARHDALRSGADPGALEIKITTDDEDGKTLIVEDDGFGMTRASSRKIWEPSRGAEVRRFWKG